MFMKALNKNQKFNLKNRIRSALNAELKGVNIGVPQFHTQFMHVSLVGGKMALLGHKNTLKESA